MICLMEKTQELDKLCEGLSSSAIGLSSMLMNQQ